MATSGDVDGEETPLTLDPLEGSPLIPAFLGGLGFATPSQVLVAWVVAGSAWTTGDHRQDRADDMSEGPIPSRAHGLMTCDGRREEGPIRASWLPR